MIELVSPLVDITDHTAPLFETYYKCSMIYRNLMIKEKGRNYDYRPKDLIHRHCYVSQLLEPL